MPRQRKRGRPPGPTKLTAEVQASIAESMANGMFPEFAAMRAGISPRQLYRWLARGAKTGCGRYYELMSAVKRALAEYQLTLIKQLSDADTPWKAKAWLLERRFARRYGRRVVRQIVEQDQSTGQERTLEECVERANAILAITGGEEDEA